MSDEVMESLIDQALQGRKSVKALVVATSYKPNNFVEELQAGKRYRLEYLDLSERLVGDAIDYDPPATQPSTFVRKLEETLHMDFWWARQLAAKVEEEGYDLVISMSERIAVPLGYFLNKRVKHIAIIINTKSSRWLFAMKALRNHHVWDAIVTYSYAEAKDLEHKLALQPGAVKTIHNYVDTDFFQPPNPPLEQNEEFIFSQGLAWRDYPTLIEAMRRLPHVRCQISAKSAWDDFSAGYEGLEMPDNVELVSYDHPALIRDAYARCRFLVIPLKPDATMWCSGSTSVLQAQAMAKPAVVSYLPGIAEYVDDRETGRVVPGGDSTALAEAINELWCDRAYSEAMGLRARDWIQRNFSLEAWLDKMTALVEETVGTAQTP